MANHEDAKKGKTGNANKKKNAKTSDNGKNNGGKPQKIKQTEKKSEKIKCEKKNKTLIILGSILIIVCLIVISYFAFAFAYQEKIYPRAKIEQTSINGMTEEEVRALLETYSNSLASDTVSFKYGDKTFSLEPSVFSVDNPELSYDLISINSDEMANTVYNFSRTGNFLNDLFSQVKTLFMGHSFSLDYEMNEEEIINILQNEFSEFENPALNAKLSFDTSANIEIISEVPGEVFDYENIVSELKNNILNLENNEIVLKLVADVPEIKKAEAADLISETETVISGAPFILSYDDLEWTISEDEIKQFLEFGTDGVEFDLIKMTAYLETISEEIDIPVKEGKFEVTVDEETQKTSLTQIQESENGKELNHEKTIAKINSDFIKNNINKSELAIDVTNPKVNPENLSELGIKELLGTGYTNFSGSPSNRRFNISKGADILHGLLIEPDETFSLIKTLGEIDGENGWLPELVIKENKTIPEFGGGLCQIGTTSFRMALNSGLPIVERKNHSYVVSYYNYNGKPGVDATIYDPSPDFKFKNDTGNWMLIQTHIDGNDLYFDMWGTSDGRKGYFLEPENYDFVSAP
ncbi:MAG: VanW family protein, partial [Patescibacteria group bacterium]